MDSFTISQLEQFSGIKAHTIRIWEQRYHALQPNRSPGGTRQYDGEQLRRLLNIVSLIHTDLKISDICKMSDVELGKTVKTQLDQSDSNPDTYEQYVLQMIGAGVNYDSTQFNLIYNTVVNQIGLHETYVKVIQPMLARIGLMWASEDLLPAKEHFIAHLIKQKLYSAIEALQGTTPKAKKWLLFLPENEFHEIPLLFAHFLIRSAGHSVIYLSCNVPYQTLQSALQETKPDEVLFFFIHFDFPEETQSYINTLHADFPQINFNVSGNTVLLNNLHFPSHIQVLNDVAVLEQKLVQSNYYG